MAINPIQKAQIKAKAKSQIEIQTQAQTRALIFEKAPIVILAKYSD